METLLLFFTAHVMSWQPLIVETTGTHVLV